jgi:hypothetical protein
MILTGKSEIIGEKPVPVSLCPPQIPVVGLACATRGRRLDGLNFDTAHSVCDVTSDL